MTVMWGLPTAVLFCVSAAVDSYRGEEREDEKEQGPWRRRRRQRGTYISDGGAVSLFESRRS